MLWNVAGPRPPSRRRVEKQVRRHARAVSEPGALFADPTTRASFDSLLRAHRDWRLAEYAPCRRMDEGTPVGRSQGNDDGAAATGSVTLRLVVTLTLVGDIGTMSAAVSLATPGPLPPTALLMLTPVAAALFLAHQVGAWLRAVGLGTETRTNRGTAARRQTWMERRRHIARARIHAYFRVLATDTELTCRNEQTRQDERCAARE
jgi:hypothetical protein